MNREKKKREDVLTESEQKELMDEIKELKQRTLEDEMVGDLLSEVEEERSSKKKLRELKRAISNVKKHLEQAEQLLKEVIDAREKEDREVEDTILLSDGIRKVREEEEEEETED